MHWTYNSCDVLYDPLRQLAGALTAASFDPAAGYRIGFDLVAERRITSPQALGSTLVLLHQELTEQPAIRHQPAPERLILLLSQLVVGFTEAMPNAAVAAADINRAERASWKVLNKQLQQALQCDRLTGLPNKAGLTSWLDEILAEPSDGTRLGVCLINLNRFKMVNDSLGFDKGDQLLRAVALRLRRLADEAGHFLAHPGDDEFIFVVKGTDGYDDMDKVADIAMRALRDPFTLNGHRLSISASAGIVECAATEALARWQHPTYGVISPAQFIPLAEDTGLIAPLGLRLLEQACRQSLAWRRREFDPFVISVNLSVAQLRT